MKNNIINHLIRRSLFRIRLNRFLNHLVIIAITVTLSYNILIFAELASFELSIPLCCFTIFAILLIVASIKTFRHPPNKKAILASIDFKGKTRGIFSLLFESAQDQNVSWQSEIVLHAEKQQVKLSKIFPLKVMNTSYLGASAVLTLLITFALPSQIHHLESNQVLIAQNNLALDADIPDDLSKMVTKDMSQDEVDQALKENPQNKINDAKDFSKNPLAPKSNQKTIDKNKVGNNSKADKNKKDNAQNNSPDNSTKESKGSEGAGNQETNNDKLTTINQKNKLIPETKASIHLNENLQASEMANRSTQGRNEAAPAMSRASIQLKNNRVINIQNYKEHLRPKYQRVIERYFAQDN